MPLAMLTMKKVACFSISMHACDPVPIVMVLRLESFRAAGAPQNLGISKTFASKFQ